MMITGHLSFPTAPLESVPLLPGYEPSPRLLHRWIFQHGTEAINQHLPSGHTPLTFAVVAKDHRYARMLLELARANPSAGDVDGCRPVHLAAATGDVEMIRLLVRFGADVNEADPYGQTALFYAVEYDVDVVRDLLRMGASTTPVNSNGVDAAGHAEALGRYESRNEIRDWEVACLRAVAPVRGRNGGRARL